MFKPPEQNSLAVIERVPEEQNEELWWTMDDLDRSSAEADMESMVEELEKLEELREKQGGTLTPQQIKMENDLRMQLAQAQQEQAMQQVRVEVGLLGFMFVCLFGQGFFIMTNRRSHRVSSTLLFGLSPTSLPPPRAHAQRSSLQDHRILRCANCGSRL